MYARENLMDHVYGNTAAVLFDEVDRLCMILLVQLSSVLKFAGQHISWRVCLFLNGFELPPISFPYRLAFLLAHPTLGHSSSFLHLKNVTAQPSSATESRRPDSLIEDEQLNISIEAATATFSCCWLNFSVFN